MNKFTLPALALGVILSGGAVLAQSAPTALGLDNLVDSRKWIMRNLGGAAGAGGAMLQGEVPYSPATAQLVFRTMNQASYAFGHYFPEGSGPEEGSRAAPAIWENPEGFRTILAQLESASRAGLQADPQDVEAFQPLFGAATQTCNSCHEQFRLPEN